MAKKTLSFLRKITVLAVGIPVLILGVILIPLPGPGLLVMLLGLLILSLEFDWAEKYVQMVRQQLDKITAGARKQIQGTTEKDRDKPKDS